MAVARLTYAHADNANRDVDFIAHDLSSGDLQVKQDRFVLGAGLRLWEQVEAHICNPSDSDA